MIFCFSQYGCKSGDHLAQAESSMLQLPLEQITVSTLKGTNSIPCICTCPMCICVYPSSLPPHGMLHINIYQFHKHMTMLVPTVGFGCFFDFQMSLLRAVFELFILKQLCHSPREERQILPLTKHHTGVVWDSLGILQVPTGSSWWRYFNISLGFSINISSKCRNKMRNQSPPPQCLWFYNDTRVSAAGKRSSARA